MAYRTFLPNYYGSLIRGQQNALLLDNLYFYVADGVTQTATANSAPKCIRDEQVVINEIIYGGKMVPSNLVAMVRKITWTQGKIFSAYKSRDPNLVDKDFYVLSSNNRVYKCLDNNKNSPSLVEPTTNVPGPHTLSDGYTWIFMSEITNSQLNDYSVGDYIPVFQIPEVKAAAIQGTVTTIDVKNPGEYRYVDKGLIQNRMGTRTFRISDIAHNLSGVYNSMGFYIESGAGVGGYSQITDYTANTSGRYVTLADNLPDVGIGSGYDIAPFVRITGNGMGAKARTIMVNNRVDKIEVLNHGQYYTNSDANLIANTAHIIVPGELETNLSPIKGHGGDLYQELYVDNVMFNVYFDNYTISDDLPVDDISFCKVGLIREVLNSTLTGLYTDDTFNNTFNIRITPSVGNYSVGDVVTSTSTGHSGKLVFANNSHIIGTYSSPLMSMNTGETLINNEGVSGLIQSITQPQVKLLTSDIVALVNADTIKRDENSNEYLQILIKVK